MSKPSLPAVADHLAKDDPIMALTRAVAIAVAPVLILAFIILYITPERTGEQFAWEIKPSMTAVFMGAGCLGEAWVFINVSLGRRCTGGRPVSPRQAFSRRSCRWPPWSTGIDSTPATFRFSSG